MVKVGHSLREVAKAGDYYLKKQADITIGLWALLWCVLPLVGTVLGIRALVVGSRRKRASVAIMGMGAVLLSSLVGYGYYYAAANTHDTLLVSAFTLETSPSAYADLEGRRYLLPKGMKIIDESVAGAYFATQETDENGFLHTTGDKYSVTTAAVEAGELSSALESMTDMQNEQHALWWTRFVPEYARMPHKIGASTTQQGVTYIDVELQRAEGDEGSNRIAMTVRALGGQVVVQSLAYTTYLSMGIIDSGNDAWRRIAQSLTVDTRTKPQGVLYD